MKAEHALLATLIAVVVAFAGSAYAIVRFYTRLKRYEFNTWRALGSPMLTLDRPKATADFIATRRFLRSGDHRSLNDKKSVSLGDLVVLTDRALLAVIFLASAVAGYIVVFVDP